jgi:NADPH:quinone reductase-like Zn-dependent oxidoreductase
MHAAVVSAFNTPPRYQEMDTPQPRGPHEVLVEVLAAGLHPRVRSQANGSHYTSTDELPLVPGIDGVGRLADGRHVYFVLPDTTMGAMAEQTVVDLRRSVVLPDGADPVVLAAAMNPGMSSWVGLRRRLDFKPGQSVLVMGATGNAGQLAIQIAKYCGASQVIGAGRDPALLAVLPGLGADATVSLDGDAEQVAERLGQAAAEVDVVVDYLWGAPTELAVTALLTARSDRDRALTWLQIGSIAGPTAALPSVAFRSANFQVLGSGQGSVSTGAILAELPELAAQIVRGTFAVNPVPVALADVEQTWTAPTAPGERVVIVPTVGAH